MAKIVSMSSGAIDPIAQSKRVFFRSTDSVTLAVGDAVCYKNDAVDHKERTIDPVHLGLTRDTYAEGEQEMTGRLFNVEEPLVDNLDQFAGIVKVLGPKAGADGDLIEIWTGNSGAVVPCNIDTPGIETVVGRTILAVKSGQRTLDEPTCDCDDFGYDTAGTVPTRSIGIAMEARDDAGKCWVKLQESLFTHQSGNDGQELQVSGAANLVVNKSFIDFKNTDGHSCAWLWRTRLSGVGSGAQKGVYRFDVMMDAASYGEFVKAVEINLEVACSVSQVPPAHVYALSIMMRTASMNPNMSATSLTAVVNLESFLRKTAGDVALDNPPAESTWFRFNANGSVPEHLFYAQGPGILNASEAAGTAATVTGFDGDAVIWKIPINIDGTTTYLLAGTPAETAD